MNFPLPCIVYVCTDLQLTGPNRALYDLLRVDHRSSRSSYKVGKRSC